jgi:DNA-binding NarL/FixJ family response regulator
LVLIKAASPGERFEGTQMDVDGMFDQSVHRRWLLLSRALESMPLDEALRLARSTEDFLSAGSGIDVANTLNHLQHSVAIQPFQPAAAAKPCLDETNSCLEGSSAPEGNASVPASNGVDQKDSRLAFTRRESQILAHLVRGDSNKAIARNLQIQEGTVRLHLKSVFRKISAVNRTQAAIWAMNSGFGQPPLGT